MDFAFPHIVVRTLGGGSGGDLVAALSIHPLEVSEARDHGEALRVAGIRPAVLVVAVGEPEGACSIATVAAEFPGLPILLVSDAPAEGIESISAALPLPDICFLVVHAVSRAPDLPGIAGDAIMPLAIEIDERGVVLTVRAVHTGWLIDGGHVSAGTAIAPLIAPPDQEAFMRAVRRAVAGETQFLALRVRGGRGAVHAVHVGLRAAGPGRVVMLIQPLVVGGPNVGGHADVRDPITGLLTRWALYRAMDERERSDPAGNAAALVFLKLDHFQAVAESIGFQATDTVLIRVASAVVRTFDCPAVSSRLMGDSFLVFVPDRQAAPRIEADAERLIQTVNGIRLPGFAPDFHLGASVGIATVTDRDHDLAVRRAEAAVSEAQMAGGNRVVVAGSASFTRHQADELAASMDLGDWEMWLQPVVRAPEGHVEFHEALARFGGGRRPMASRADFFTAGQARGLLERFDRMLLLRALDLLAAQPDARVAVNVSYETFSSATFPDGFIDVVRQVSAAAGRIIVEIAPRCMALPDDAVRRRLDRLAGAGIPVAIDDFGSGVCLLRYLTQFSLALVKLDALVTGYVDDDPLQRGFVRTVVGVCRARGIETVAEYTRSPEQMARLIEDGVDLFQGELVGMPRPASEVFRTAGVSSPLPP